MVKLADGARDNWDFLSDLDLGLSPTVQARVEQIEIVDFCHAADHLKRGCDAIWPHDSDKSLAKFESLRTLLKEVDGGADKVIGSFRYYVGRLSGKTKASLQTELTYFRNQRPRMDYAAYLRHGLHTLTLSVNIPLVGAKFCLNPNVDSGISRPLYCL